MEYTYKDKKISLVLLCGAVLLFIWPFPGSMALRYLALVAGAIAFLASHPWGGIKAQSHADFHKYLLPILFLWIAFQSTAIAPAGAESLQDIATVWLRSFLAMIVGWGSGLALSVKTNKAVEVDAKWINHKIFYVGLSGTFIIYYLIYIQHSIVSGEIIQRDFYAKTFINKPPIVVFIGVLIPVFLISLRSRVSKNSFFVKRSLAAIGLIASVLALYTSGSKNGIAIFVFILLIFLSQIAWQGELKIKTKKDLGVAIIASIALVVILFVHDSEKPAWKNLIADAKIGFDINGQVHWKDFEQTPIPQNALLTPVNDSTYLRTAWAIAGLHLAVDHPLGYGSLRKSFVDLARAKWPDFYPHDASYRNTHSGWIDITLAIGIPGTLLMLAALWWPALQSTRDLNFDSYKILAAATITCAYLFSEIAMDYFIEFYIFLAALFSTKK